MSAESELNDALLADAALTAVVGSHIYPDFIAQEIVPPAIVYQRQQTQYFVTVHDAVVHGSKVTMEVHCLHVTRIGAEELGDLVEGALAASTLSPPPFHVIPIERRPEYEPESERYITVVVCDVWPGSVTP